VDQEKGRRKMITGVSSRKEVVDWKTVISDVNKVNVLTERVKKRKAEVIAAPRHISAKRSRLATDSWKETEAYPLNYRRAKVFQNIMEGNPIAIWDDELIVGSQSEFLRGASPPTDFFPEITWKVVTSEKPTTGSAVVFALLSDEDRASLKEDAEYWKDRSPVVIGQKRLFDAMGEDIEVYRRIVESGAVALWGDRIKGNMNIDYGKVIDIGFNGIIEEATAECDNLKDFSSEEDLAKLEFLKAGIICCQAVITFARRYARLAREMAGKEKNPGRKAELLKVAETCEWVPARPARSFREALQSFWFTHVAANLEGADYAETPGRMDQYLYPLYESDISTGNLTRQEAAELLGCLWVKFNEMECVRGEFIQKYSQSSQNQHITIGGVDEDGGDATNELSAIILEVARQMKLPQSAIYIKWHKGLNEEFLVKAAETNRDHGAGIPAFLNDDLSINKYLSLGVPLKDARNWIAIGCVGPVLSHCTGSPYSGTLLFNKSKMFELALNNGVDPRTGKMVGIETGDPRNFKSYQECYDAFINQFKFFMEKANKFMRVVGSGLKTFVSFPYCSMLTDDCIKHGRGIYQGGPRFQADISILDSGLQNVGDSLAAIKKLVYDEKKVSMDELLNALAVNFEGKEELRQLLLTAPAYGNDDDYADNIFNAVSWDTGKIATDYHYYSGSPTVVFRGGATQHYWAGGTVGALPDGRKAREPLADGILSPSQGRDVKGPTAVMRSATKMNHLEHAVASLHNVKLSPSTLRTREGINKFLFLIKTYFDLGGWHLQFNMIGQEAMIEAQKYPEQHKDLVVRVAGYSAFFVDLSPEVQNDIITRTEFGL
jgi:pyruvate formate-lyase/glycerol dehydratase family glycyl radical enzyme